MALTDWDIPLWKFVLFYLLGIAGFLGAVILVAWYFGLDEDAVFAMGLAAFVFICTWLKPFWFWDHPKAFFLRNALGDTATTVLYVLAALWFFSLGYRRFRDIAASRRECAAYYAVALEPAVAAEVDTIVPRPGVITMSKYTRALSCGYLREQDAR